MIYTFSSNRIAMLFEMWKASLELNPRLIHEEILTMQKNMIISLSENNLKYDELKPALVPNHKKDEAAFLFDVSKIESVTYGYEILDHLFPLLNKETTQSILLGDLIGRDKKLILSLVKKFLKSRKHLTITNSRNIFCVYLNNLSKKMLEVINEGLSQYHPYIGYVPTTYSSLAKAYFSSVLVSGCLKHKNNIILSHEDDTSDVENVNLGAPAFEENGYTVRSIKSIHFDHFLSYKIESSLPDFHKAENYFSINLLSKDVVDFDDLYINIETDKHKYLLGEKYEKMKQAELENLSKEELEELIKEKMQLSYIYNLDNLVDHNVIKFNMMIEVKRADGTPSKLTVAVEYIFDTSTLRVITAY